MQITSIGRLSVWLGAALLALGLFFSNFIIIALSGFVILVIVYHGFIVRRIFSVTHPPISVKIHATVEQASTEREFSVETIIQSKINGDLRIAEFGLEISGKSDQETFGLGPLLNGTERLLKTNVTPHAEGVLEVTGVTIVLEKRPYLFSQTFHVDENLRITVRPTGTGLNSLTGLDALSDLRSDPLRRGLGSEFAGIRPLNFLDDFHSVDWKATARTGKMMTKEYFLERENPIVLLVDVSVLQRSDASKDATTLLKQLWSMLEDHQLSANPLGLVLCDRSSVAVEIPPSTGLDNREKIGEALLAHVDALEKAEKPSYGTAKSLAMLVEQIDALKKTRVQAFEHSAFKEKLSALIEMVLPFYERSRSKYFSELRGQGVFKAFVAISAFREPTLVVAISDGRRNINGLLEGADVAARAGHRVIIAFLDETRSVQDLSSFAKEGVQIVICETVALWSSVSETILALGRTRMKLSALDQMAKSRRNVS